MSIDDYSSLFNQAGQQYNVDPSLLRAVAITESNGNPDAISDAGAQGLMQLMPATAKSLGVKDATDPAQAIPAAARLLRQNLDRYKNTQSALMAYNGGTDSSNWNNAETQNYPTKVLKNYKGAQVASNQPMDEDDQIAAAAIQRQLAKNSASTSPSQSMDEDDAIAAAAIQRQKDKSTNSTQTTKANPSLSDQYNSDVNTAANRIANSLKNSPGGALDNLLDAGGAVGSGVASAIGQTVNHYTPDMVKNALQAGWEGFKEGPQSTADLINSTGAGQSAGNALMGASNATSNALTGAAQEFPNATRRIGDVVDIGKGMAAVGGARQALGTGIDLVENAPNALVGAGKMIINPKPLEADAANVFKNAKDEWNINTPASLMSTGENRLQNMASKSDIPALTPQVNRGVNDIMGANEKQTFNALNSKSILAAEENNSAAYNKVYSDIGNVPVQHLTSSTMEIAPDGTPVVKPSVIEQAVQQGGNTPLLRQVLDDIKAKTLPDGTIPASAIKELTKVGGKGKNTSVSILQQLAANKVDTNASIAAGNIIDHLDSALQTAATPEQYSRIKAIDARYKTMKTMEALAGTTGAGSQASIPAIQNALNTSFSGVSRNPVEPARFKNYLNTVNPLSKSVSSFPGIKYTESTSNGIIPTTEMVAAIASQNPYLATLPLAQKGFSAAKGAVASKLINTDWYKNRLLQNAP